jgi:hypothetical protein
MTTRTFNISILTAEHPYERVLKSVCLALVGILAFAYVYFVFASVLHIIARKEAYVHVVKINSTIAELEEDYFVLATNVTKERSNDFGLVAVEDKSYVTRTNRLGYAEAEGNEI